MDIAPGKEVKEPKPTVLSITLYPDGKSSVSGPIENKLLSYGMLELAREAVQKYNEKASSNRIFEGGKLKGFLGLGK